MPPQIVVENLTKTFRVAERDPGVGGAFRGLVRRRHREIAALGGISFALEQGELVGYIGPNGAGKSTTVKVLAGILVPDGGRCEVMGRVPWRERVAHVAGIGVVFGQRTQLWWDLPVVESFDLLRDIYRVPAPRYAATRDELIALLSLEPLLDVPVRQLSLGPAHALRPGRRAAPCAADPVPRRADHRPRRGFQARRARFRPAAQPRARRHRDPDDARHGRHRGAVHARHRDRGGQIVSDGTLEDLRGRVTRERWLIVDLEDADDEIADPDAQAIRRDGHRVTLAFDPARVTTAALIARVAARHPVRDLFVQNPPIEEIIARLYGEGAD
jgi:ABC-2 type transport system ATP-binding protein